METGHPSGMDYYQKQKAKREGKTVWIFVMLVTLRSRMFQVSKSKFLLLVVFEQLCESLILVNP